MASRSSFRTPLGAVRGLGSAKDGVGQWWSQRLSSIALVPLSIWFVASVAAMAGAPYEVFTAWVAQPLVAILLILLLAVGFFHVKLGIQVVIEDYVHGEGVKIAALVLNAFGCTVLALASIFSVLKIAL